MISNSSSNIENLITQLLIDSRYVEALELGHKQYQIRQYKIDTLAPNQIFAMYYSLSTRFYYSKPVDNQQSWHENELRIFIWLLIGYSFLHTRCVSKMTQQDWLFFSRIFNNRNPEVFEFQALSILKKEAKFIKWTEQQVQLLQSIIRSKQAKNKWNQIAKELFLVSNKRFFRTAKQCRECWINHLDPTPKHSFWRTSEDLQLVKAVGLVGKKWAKVSKILNGTRTQHMVKNRFKSLYQHHIKSYQAQELQSLKQERIIQALEEKLVIKQEEQLKIKKIQEEKLQRKEKVQKGENQIQIEGQLKNQSAEEKITVDIEHKEEDLNQIDLMAGLEVESQRDAENDQVLKFGQPFKTFYSLRNILDESNMVQLAEQDGEMGLLNKNRDFDDV